MKSLFPEIDAYSSGFFKTLDAHDVFFEECGNPNGQPVVFLHGGPGSGSHPVHRRFFDPVHYRIILIDQRGCGRSLPLGSIENNTTADLVEDLNQIRQHLNIDRWLVFGGSWGSTLALSYALTYPNDVTGLILRGIFLSSEKELQWFLGESALFFPEPWQSLIERLPARDQSKVLNAYQQLIFCEDTNISVPAATAWNNYESNIMSLLPSTSSGKPVPDDIQLARARVQIHYIVNACFVAQYDFLNNMHKLSHIPTSIVQGRYDMVCPPLTAWQLKQAMPHAEFHMIPDAGHSGMETGTLSALVTATEKFKTI